jgi:hypothetical protein
MIGVQAARAAARWPSSAAGAEKSTSTSALRARSAGSSPISAPPASCAPSSGAIAAIAWPMRPWLPKMPMLVMGSLWHRSGALGQRISRVRLAMRHGLAYRSRHGQHPQHRDPDRRRHFGRERRGDFSRAGGCGKGTGSRMSARPRRWRDPVLVHRFYDARRAQLAASSPMPRTWRWRGSMRNGRASC